MTKGSFTSDLAQRGAARHGTVRRRASLLSHRMRCRKRIGLRSTVRFRTEPRHARSGVKEP